MRRRSFRENNEKFQGQECASSFSSGIIPIREEDAVPFHSNSYQAKTMQKPFQVREVFLVLSVLGRRIVRGK
jgi:hypothetical protein